MVSTQWKVRPVIDPGKSTISLGPGAPGEDGLWLGVLGESGSTRTSQVRLSTAKEQVIAVVGKRGSGKSFTLGVIAEGLVCEGNTKLGRQENPRAVLLFDPLDTYWSTRYPVSPSENAEAQRHYQLAKSAGITSFKFNVQAWIPGEENRRNSDPEWFQTLRLSVPAMGLDEWGLLLDVDVIADPMGQLFADVLRLVKTEGYQVGTDQVPPTTVFDLQQLANAVNADEVQGIYHEGTLRALTQRLSAMQGTGLFAQDGTSIGQLLCAGRASVVLLGRLPEGYRAAIVAILTRMLIAQRQDVSFAEKRLALDPELTEQSRQTLEHIVNHGVPRTVVVLDEAQAFLAPGPRNPARQLFVRLVKEGRNMGLSAVIATQQPSALDKAVLSQVITFIAHQLVTEGDIKAVRDNLKSSLPDSISYGKQELDTAALLRMLPPGTCLISASDMNTTTRRALIVSVRPRATVHGGIEL